MQHNTLTPNGVEEILKNLNTPCVMQVINLQNESDEMKLVDNEVTYRSEISDGFSKITCYWTKAVFPLIDANRTKFNGCVVEILQYLSTKKNVLVQDFRIIYFLDQLIGNAIHHKDFVKGNFAHMSTNRIDTTKVTKFQEPIHTNLKVQAKMENLRLENAESPTTVHKDRPSSEAVPHRDVVSDFTDYQSIEILYRGMDNWRIICRVMKASYRQFENSKKYITKLLELQLCDKDGWSIKAVMFGDFASMKKNTIVEGQVYIFSQGVINLDQFKKTTRKKESDCTITLTEHSEIRLAVDDGRIQPREDHYKTIESIRNSPPGTEVSVVGILRKIDPESEIVSKQSNDKISKKVVYLSDPRIELETDVVFWRGQTSMVDPQLEGKAVHLEAFKVHEYNGKLSLTASFKSRVYPLKNHPLNKYESQKIHQQFPTISYRREEQPMGMSSTFTVKKVMQEMETIRDKQHISSVFRVYVTHIQEKGNKWYSGCPQETCRKTVEPESKMCSACMHTFEKPTYRYILGIQLSDFLGTGTFLSTAFDSFANKIFSLAGDYPVDTARNMSQEDFSDLCKSCLFQEFKICFHSTNHHDNNPQRSIKHQISRVIPIDYAQEAKDNLNHIRRYYI